MYADIYTNIHSSADSHRCIRTSIDTRAHNDPEAHKHRYINTQTHLRMESHI